MPMKRENALDYAMVAASYSALIPYGLMSYEDAAAYLGIKRTAIRAYTTSGRLRRIYPGIVATSDVVRYGKTRTFPRRRPARPAPRNVSRETKAGPGSESP